MELVSATGATRTAGTWIVRGAEGKGTNWTKAFATADDFDDADGETVLNFWQAQDRARTLVRNIKSPGADDGMMLRAALGGNSKPDALREKLPEGP
jgi:hypothetical protein